MKTPCAMTSLPLVLAAALFLGGCGRREESDHAHAKQSGHGNGHGHGEESPSGASFKAGTGVVVTEETRNLLNLAVEEVKSQKITNQIDFTLQIFAEKHRHISNPEDHSGCDVHGSALLSSEAATLAKPGQSVFIPQNSNQPLHGLVLSMHKALLLGESEIIVGISNATTLLKAGEFVPAHIRLPHDEPTTTVPESALLRTSEGTFVYAVNGGAYFRTPVKVGAEADGVVEITDGLLEGDQVVTQPVQTLWLIELRATKGGGHCH